MKCGHCGKENPDEAFNCYGCGNDLAKSEAPVIKETKAGFFIRAVARLIDTVFAFAVSFISGPIAVIVLNLLAFAKVLPDDWKYHLQGFSFSVYFFSYLGGVLYHTFCEGIYGATLGKLCCGIRVVRLDKSPCDVSSAFKRSLAFTLDGMFFGLVGYCSMQKTPFNQRYGDLWAKTIVVKNNEIPRELERDASFLIAGLVTGITVFISSIIFGMILKVYSF
ncbi:MAG TPA: RDD family protein [Candidatus Sulfotelmatobacter sp.]|jgi:uncharacterized RDD family membrane protein YckC|nr:RDD family protein [Candidatus Sulfotelmatobacter sp.]